MRHHGYDKYVYLMDAGTRCGNPEVTRVSLCVFVGRSLRAGQDSGLGK